MSLIDKLREGRLSAYRAAPRDIREHFGIEETVLAGGYGYRQVMELIQNGADAILEDQEANGRSHRQERITVALVDDVLYVANTGSPLNEEGVNALLQSHSSPKRGNQIGRFGIGFKSLLRLDGRIDLISRGLSMRFDPDEARRLIRREFALDESVPVPALRVAWDLDGEAERLADPVLGRYDWATTIVRAQVRNEMMLGHLRDEMEKFPGGFLLFLPVSVELTMDFGDGTVRRLERRPEGQELVLVDGEESSRWLVVERMVTVTDTAAKNDATHLHARDQVPLAWALPLETKREEAGRFWAFFPTETPTRLPGILNAPWKLNSDRRSLIDGEWNRFLMMEAGTLVAETLPTLATEGDPGKPIDVFPRRVERKDEVAAVLVESLWERLVDLPVIPDCTGALRFGQELKIHPVGKKDLAESWVGLSSGELLTQWLHPSCLEGDRRARVDELAQRIGKRVQGADEGCRPNLQTSDPGSWFAAVATTETETALKVLALAERYAGEVNQAKWRTERGSLEIVPTASGGLSSASKAVIAPVGASVPGRELVLQAIIDDELGGRVLAEVLGVEKLDDEGWNRILRDAFEGCSRGKPIDEEACDRMWKLFRTAPESVTKAFVQSNARGVLVRRIDRKWKRFDEVLRPGQVVAADDKENQAVLVDPEFHEGDAELLDLIGVREFPRGSIGPIGYRTAVGSNSGLLGDWWWHAHGRFSSSLDGKGSPRNSYLDPKEIVLPRGWTLLHELKGGANAKATRELLEQFSKDESYRLPVKFGHDTRDDHYGTVEVPSPTAWLLSQYGTIAVGRETIGVGTMIAQLEQPILDRVTSLRDLLPSLRLLSAHVLAKDSIDVTTRFWRVIFGSLVTAENVTEVWLRDLWDGGARDGWVPENLPTSEGVIPLNQVYVAVSHDLGRQARLAGLFVVEVSPATAERWCKKGALDLSEMFSVEWRSVLGPESLLVEAVPECGEVLTDGARENATCRSVDGLKVRFEDHTGSVPCVMWKGVLCQDIRQLDALPRITRLETILQEVENAGWLSMPVKHALRKIGDSRVDERRVNVAAGADLEERLLRAVGGRTAALFEAMGDGGRKALPEDPPPRQVAALALALLGPLVLQKLADTLRDEGLLPPGRWGTSEARSFVASLGFPEEFAASPESKRDAELVVSGPIPLPGLHDFQEEVVRGLRDLIDSGEGRRRAVVSLPTGGGKTRAAVQAAVELVLAPPSSRRTVLWIAQTDELCEQAVQAFRQVWANIGAQSTDLRVVRLWGGHGNPARSEKGQPVAVVASIQTLNSRVGQEDLTWLSEPGIVVIDECHHAITKSYTGVLRWLDSEAPRSGDVSGKEPPVIGLSATPFRGSQDDEESLRLAKRFDRRWLPGNQESLYKDLLARGILAHAAHESLETNVGVPEELLIALEGLEVDGVQAENLLDRINQSLADDVGRNDLLVETISTSGASSILCFANSVGHAEELAARLCVRGIPAAAVSGETPRAARRYFLSRFQSGEVRVLCNYAVLSTGFDAPKTDMLLISRHVMSPVRYMQMVGRGLRGPANGGTERCRIVTVMDNLGRFSGRHPYHYCAKFFTEEGVRPTGESHPER